MSRKNGRVHKKSETALKEPEKTRSSRKTHFALSVVKLKDAPLLPALSQWNVGGGRPSILLVTKVSANKFY